MSGFSLERPIVTHSLVVSVLFSAVFITAITIIGELNPPIKNWLAETHGHHWVGKGIWTIILFVVVAFTEYLRLKITHTPVSARMVLLAGYAAIIGSVLMTLFFTGHYFHWF